MKCKSNISIRKYILNHSVIAATVIEINDEGCNDTIQRTGEILSLCYITDNITIYMETLSDISVFLSPVQKTKWNQCIVNILMCTLIGSVMLFTLHPGVYVWYSYSNISFESKFAKFYQYFIRFELASDYNIRMTTWQIQTVILYWICVVKLVIEQSRSSFYITLWDKFENI